MANAFTPSWTGRPIPADLDNRPQVGNAFEGGENMTAPAAQTPTGGNAFPTASPMAQMGGYLPAAQASVAAASFAALHKQSMTTAQVVSLLQDSIYPSHREWAADQLARLDWHQQQEIVPCLVECASKDPAGTVRAACVRSLGRMKVNTLPVVTALQGMQRDLDLRVRQEATEALTAMGATPAKDSSVQRAGYSPQRYSPQH
jgi:hypothetical protein